MHLYAVSDFNQWRLVKQKMATIFRPDFCWALTSYTVDSSLGIFGGEDHVMRALEDTKKQKMLIEGSVLTTKRLRSRETSPQRTEARSLQLEEPKPKAKKEPKRRIGLNPKPR